MPKGKRNKSKVQKITEEEYVQYVASLKEETPLPIYKENVAKREVKKEKEVKEE